MRLERPRGIGSLVWPLVSASVMATITCCNWGTPFALVLVPLVFVSLVIARIAALSVFDSGRPERARPQVLSVSEDLDSR